MAYFLALCGIVALAGLALVSASHEMPLTLFGYGLFGFGVLFSFFLLKKHFDAADAARH